MPLSSDHTLIAVRSLQSVHHAENLVPRIVKVVWNLGKRCNYDCSYCTPHIHDAVSPHIELDHVRSTVQCIDREMSSRGKKANYSFTGGEPFLHPAIEEILRTVSTAPGSDSSNLSVVTNGSLPLPIYQRCMPYVTNLTVSLHFERIQAEIDRAITTLITLADQWPDRFFSVTVMFLPGTADRVLAAKQRLESYGIRSVLRKIRPNTDGSVDSVQVIQPFHSRRDKTLARQPIDAQSIAKKAYKQMQDQHLRSWYQSYYAPEELSILEQHDSGDVYHNMAVWTHSQDYIETNSDDVLNQCLNDFQGWSCFSGTDQIYINFDGRIYNGNCLAYEIGHVATGIHWPGSAVQCPMINCTSNPDVIVRKAHPDWVSLVQD